MSELRVLIKDDADLFEMIQRGRELRRQMGIPEPTEEFDAREAGKTWHEMRKKREARLLDWKDIEKSIDL